MLSYPNVKPGIYPGPGQATLLHSNDQQYLWGPGQVLVAGTTKSIAVQLERIRFQSYPWGAAFECGFSGAPGTFEIDIQFAELDVDASYFSVGTITAVNTGNVGRYDMPGTVFPKYVRGFCKTFPNAVTAYLLATH